MFKIIDMLSEAGSPDKPNEDLIFCSDNCIAVLDGATNLIGSEYGANEFVRDFAERFRAFIKYMPLTQAVCTAISELYKFKLGDSPMPHDISLYSSAAAAFAVETESSLSILTLGDCTALVFTDDGITKIKSVALDKLDDTVKARLKQLHEKTGANVSGLLRTDEIRNLLIQNRKTMNTANGYDSLAFNMKQLTDADVTHFDKTTVKKVVLFSDGFESMEREIINGIPFKTIYDDLRQKENADPELNTDPRFKMSDDASIISFAIEK